MNKTPITYRQEKSHMGSIERSFTDQSTLQEDERMALSFMDAHTCGTRSKIVHPRLSSATPPSAISQDDVNHPSLCNLVGCLSLHKCLNHSKWQLSSFMKNGFQAHQLARLQDKLNWTSEVTYWNEPAEWFVFVVMYVVYQYSNTRIVSLAEKKDVSDLPWTQHTVV